MKHLHLLMVVVTIGLFFYHSVAILKARSSGYALKAVSHIIYALLLVSGLYLFYGLWQLRTMIGVQYWPMVKLGCLLVAVGLFVGARRSHHKTPMVAGAWVLVVVMLGLALFKPF